MFANNRDALAKGFLWQNTHMSVVASALLTSGNRAVDLQRMKECKKILKKHIEAFSALRNNMMMPVITKMALSDNPEEYLSGIKEVYAKLHKGKLIGSEYMALTAMLIYDNRGNLPVDATVEKTKQLISILKKSHPFLTSSEDMAMIALLAMVSKENNELVNDVENIYKILGHKFTMHANSVYSLSMVLATDEQSVEAKCEKVVQIYDAMHALGKKYGKGYELASIGTLVGIDVSPTELAKEIAEADEYLKTRKGFGAWGTGSSARLMYAAMLVVNSHSSGKNGMDAALVSAALSVVIATQVAIVGAIAASSAASATN